MFGMKIGTIVITLCVLISNPPQAESFEKQAMAIVQRTPVGEFDPELPKDPFGTWFKQLVGPQAGIIWQLTECGEPINVPGETEQDIPACVEANAILPGYGKVIVVIAVGTFRKGLTGQPTFFHAFVDQNYQLNLVRRLHDLPRILRTPGSLSSRLPDSITDLPSIKLTAYPTDSSIPSSDFNPLLKGLVEVDAPPPPPIEPIEPKKIEESVLLGNAITKIMPAYPASARGMNAYGNVEVRVTISEKGKVIEAKAISGHPALRSTAVDAARKWVFRPTTFNGTPVQVQSVLTFIFTPRTQ